MSTRFLGLALAGFAAACVSNAHATSCETWKAGRELVEEGATMMASVCATGHPDDVINVSCGGEGRVRLTYVPAIGDDYPPEGNMEYKTDLEFRAGEATFTLTVEYEAMDGILAARPYRKDALLPMLKGDVPFTVTDKSGVLPARTFGVKGSTAAVEKVENGCYN